MRIAAAVLAAVLAVSPASSAPGKVQAPEGIAADEFGHVWVTEANSGSPSAGAQDAVTEIDDSDGSVVRQVAHPVVEHWNGKAWSQSAATHLAASCRLANCGFAGTTTPTCGSPHFCLALPGPNPTGILSWNGTKWGIAKLALIAGHRPKITSLSCGSPTNCMVSGTYQRTPRSAVQPAVEHWNGKSWKVTPITKP